MFLHNDKINVALLWPKYGGNVTSVNDLVVGLDKKRFNVIFVFLSGDGGKENFLRDAGYKVLYLSNAKRINAFRFPVLFRLFKILKEHKVDVLHCHAHKATVYGAMAATLAGTPAVLAHVHGLGRSRNLRRKLTNLLLFRKIQRVICVAYSVKEDVSGNNWRLPAAKVTVLENSVDYERFVKLGISKEDAKRMLGIPSDAFAFGTVGRLVPTKGLSYMVEAFAKVKSDLPSAHLVLLGDGYCRAELQKQAADLRCSNSVHLLGRRENVEQLLRGMDVFVLSSVAEGMPRSILEAMAAGVPCVATEVGGIPEIINGDDVGLLVPAKDSAALAKAMITVAKMPKNQLAELIRNAQNRVKQVYSHDVVRERLKSLYEEEFRLCVKNR